MSEIRHVKWIALFCLPFLLTTLACSRSDVVENADTQPRTQSADPMAGAPADWLEFVQWAEKKLDSHGSSVPMPGDVELPASRWELIRLDEARQYLAAKPETAAAAPVEPAAPLVELGPLTTDRPSPTFFTRLMPKSSTEGEDSLQIQISGFEVQRETVGSILMELRVPYGRHLTLGWSDLGSLLIPVESHDEPFHIRILTDGFSDWTGPLQNLVLVTDGMGAGAIEIRSLKMLPRTSSFPLAVGRRRLRLGDEIRNALYARKPAEIRFEGVPLPPNAKLATGVGFITPNPAMTERIQFQIIVSDGQAEKVVLDETLIESQAWRDVSVALTEWAGRTISLTLRAETESPQTVACWGNPCIYEALEKPPILVVYLIDTVAAEHIGFQGYNRPTMPNLEALSRRGVWFSRMYSNSSRTVESIPDLMLSLPVEQHGVYHNSTPASEELVTIADSLRAEGMATVSFCTNVNAGPRQGMDHGFDTFVDKISTHVDPKADRTIPLEETLTWIEQHADRPMFLYIHTAEPHSPYTPPPGYSDRYDPDYTGKYIGIDFYTAKDPRDLAHIQALYDEELTYADARLGLFIEALERRGYMDRTDLFVTSDHGEEFLQHNNWEHGRNLHNEQTRVPLVVCGPSFDGRGSVDVPVQILDLMPTILALYDAPAPYPLAGRSLLPLLQSQAAPDPELLHRDLFASNHNFRIEFKLYEYSLIEDGARKLLFSAAGVPMFRGGPTSRFMLFDMARDPRERHNLINADRELSRRLIEKLLTWHAAQHVYTPSETSATVIDVIQMQELERLGYLGDKTAPDHIKDESKEDQPKKQP